MLAGAEEAYCLFSLSSLWRLSFLGHTLRLHPKPLLPQRSLCWGGTFINPSVLSPRRTFLVAGTSPPGQPRALPTAALELETPGNGERPRGRAGTSSTGAVCTPSPSTPVSSPWAPARPKAAALADTHRALSLGSAGRSQFS